MFSSLSYFLHISRSFARPQERKSRQKSLDVFRHSVEKLHGKSTTKPASSKVFEMSYCKESSKQNIEK